MRPLDGKHSFAQIDNPAKTKRSLIDSWFVVGFICEESLQHGSNPWLVHFNWILTDTSMQWFNKQQQSPCNSFLCRSTIQSDDGFCFHMPFTTETTESSMNSTRNQQTHMKLCRISRFAFLWFTLKMNGNWKRRLGCRFNVSVAPNGNSLGIYLDLHSLLNLC